MSAQRVTRLRALVRGNVQGVGFRYWTERAARRLPLTGGRVRNRADGTVEVEAEAVERTALDGLLQALHRGPAAARVESVEVDWNEDVEPRFTSFRIEGL